MRVRLGFVSNSSSSSFILYSTEDRGAAYSMFLSFLRDEPDAISSYLASGYETDIESVIQKFHASLFRTETDEDRLKDMVQECVYDIVSLYVAILADKRCLQYVKDNLCTSCGRTACKDCVYSYNIAATQYTKLRKLKRELRGIKLMPYFRELKDRVSKAKVALRNNYPTLCSYKFYEDDIDARSEEFVTAWLAINPNATIMEFYSDNQDYAEAVLRFLMRRFTKYCRDRGLRCLHVNYS